MDPSVSSFSSSRASSPIPSPTALQATPSRRLSWSRRLSASSTSSDSQDGSPTHLTSLSPSPSHVARMEDDSPPLASSSTFPASTSSPYGSGQACRFGDSLNPGSRAAFQHSTEGLLGQGPQLGRALTDSPPSSDDEDGVDTSIDDGDQVRLTERNSSYQGRGSGGAGRAGHGHTSADHRTPHRAFSVSARALGSSPTIRAVRKSFQLASARVANVGANPFRLADDDDDPPSGAGDSTTHLVQPSTRPSSPMPPTKPRVPEVLFGRSFGIFGSKSKLRRACHHALMFPWTEPVILILIVAMVVLTAIQGSRNLDSPNGTGARVRRLPWFSRWEDYPIFVLFILFTLEALARMVVTGLLIEAPPASASPFAHHSNPAIASLVSASQATAVLPVAPPQTLVGRASQIRGRLNDTFALRGSRSRGRLPEDEWVESDEEDVSFSIAPLDEHGRKVNRPAADDKQPTPSTPSRGFRSGSSSILPSSRSYDRGLPRASSKIELPFQLSLRSQRELQSLGRPYLRHSWHRLDLVAILSFWICFALSITGQESTDHRHIYIFRALSILRAGRLLVVSSGTTTILHSLKRASPLLVNVTFFIAFAISLFSVVGVQSFQGSFRRSCFITDGSRLADPTTAPFSTEQLCGGWFDPLTGTNQGFLTLDGIGGISSEAPKGYICPSGQICVQGDNQQPGQSFDNVLFSALQVVIIASSNTWSGVMYNMMDADFYTSAFFFIVGVVVLNFWFSQLLVAVITTTFSSIRAETKQSAFGASTAGPVITDLGEGWTKDPKKRKASVRLQKLYARTELLWVAIALASLAAQATKTASTSDSKLKFLNLFAAVAAGLFDIEILLRIGMLLPDWKAFFSKPRNDLDLVLAVGSSLIQIPVITRSTAYGWLTVFPLARWYRVILAFPRMRPLLLSVFGSVAGLLNLVLFLLLMNGLAALLALQLFQSGVVQDPENGVAITFGQVFNSFLGMYQVFSSENWTTPLYSVFSVEFDFHQGVIAGLFFVAWFFFSNLIMLQCFIAVIQENFAVAEEAKRAHQIQAFIEKTQPKTTNSSWLERYNPYRNRQAKPKTVAIHNLPASLVLPLKKSIVRDVSSEGTGGRPERVLTEFEKTGEEGLLSFVQRSLLRKKGPETLALQEFKTNRLSLSYETTPGDPTAAQDIDRNFDFLATSGVHAAREEQIDQAHEARAVQADFIVAHPTYDVSLWMFTQRNPIRRLCQKLVPPASGERIFGRPADPRWSFAFKLVLYATVIASIAVAGVATPMYRKAFYEEHGLQRGTWFDLVELALGGVFVVEFCVKAVADGVFFAPNAYLLSVWNGFDLAILIALLIGSIGNVVFIGGLSRASRALKAARALRLITLSKQLRETFYSILVAGAGKILDASVLVILYLIPYAVWGLNIFRGRLFSCNDGDLSILTRGDCVGEFSTSAIDGIGTGYLVPRVWDNPTFDSSVWAFDDFRQSLLILFEVVSLEGWTAVMQSLMAITGVDRQPVPNASQFNALFMVCFHLFGAVIIFTLFVTTIIENFSKRTGSALLTTEQIQWVDLQRTISQQTPAKRPKRRPSGGLKSWCFDRATQKHGWWSKGMTVLYFLHLVVLMSQSFDNGQRGSEGEFARNCVFIGFLSIYVADLVVRSYGLGLQTFRSSGWNLYDIFVISGSVACTLSVLLGVDSNAVVQLQKLFLTSVVFKLIQRINSLNFLFKTALASLPIIGNVFALWLCLFLTFAILELEVFGLTKFSTGETRNLNSRDFANALVMLSFRSTGEGWNQFMHDMTISYPRCTESGSYLSSDCGSASWAFATYILWNILSLYLFLNMFTGAVVESFAYVSRLPGKASLNREELRSFKKTWAEFDPERSGYLRRQHFVPFFSRLTGVLEVRPFPRSLSVSNLIRLSEASPSSGEPNIVEGTTHAIDVRKLSAALSQVDFTLIRERRRVYTRLYHEASISDEGGKGISFQNCLLLLAHHKLIIDDDALQVEDLLRRRAKTDLVNDLVNLDRVNSMLRAIVARRRYLAQKEERRRQTLYAGQSGVEGLPSIVINPTPSLSLDITSLSHDGLPPSPTHASNPFSLLSSFPSPASRGAGSTLTAGLADAQQHQRRTSDISMHTLGTGSESPSSRRSSIEDGELEDLEGRSAQILSELEDKWGGMMGRGDDETDSD